DRGVDQSARIHIRDVVPQHDEVPLDGGARLDSFILPQHQLRRRPQSIDRSWRNAGVPRFRQAPVTRGDLAFSLLEKRQGCCFASKIPRKALVFPNSKAKSRFFWPMNAKNRSDFDTGTDHAHPDPYCSTSVWVSSGSCQPAGLLNTPQSASMLRSGCREANN